MDIRHRLLNVASGNANNRSNRYDPLDNSNAVEMGPSSYGERMRNSSRGSNASDNNESIPLYNNRPMSGRQRYSDDPYRPQDDDEYMEFSSSHDSFSSAAAAFNRRRYDNSTASGMALNLMNQASRQMYNTAQLAGQQFARVNVDPFYVKSTWVFCLIAIIFLSSVAHMLRNDSIYLQTPGATISKPELGTRVIWAIVLYSLILILCSWSLWKHMKLRRRFAIQREFYYGSVSTNDNLL